MKLSRPGIVFALLMSLAVAQPGFAQSAVTAPVQPTLTPAEMEQFLLNAEIVSSKVTGKGVTKAQEAVLSDGRFKHKAQVQDVDIALPIFEVGPKHTEINFRDSYRYNIAGYRLALLLGLDNVPMSVERRVKGKPSAVTWWLDDVKMDEGTRLANRKKTNANWPRPDLSASQFHVLRVFDELIQNRDRNAGNILWSSDGKMWMIDHTRGFRLGKSLLKSEDLVRCERTLFEKLRGLTLDSVTAAMGGILKKDELEALIARRDVIVKLFEERIATRGEAAVLFTMPSLEAQ